MTRGVSIHSFLLDSLSLEGCQRDAADVVAADRTCHPTTAVAIHLTPDAAEKLAIAYGISLDVDTKPPCWTHGNQFKLVVTVAEDHYLVFQGGRHLGVSDLLFFELYGLQHLGSICT